jgi:hypothetical protein
MITAKTLFDQTQLPEALYAIFIDNTGGLISDNTRVPAALKDGGMSAP